MEHPQAHKERHGRRPYEKPAAHDVKLRPEEAILGMCKMLSGGGPGPFQTVCSSPGECADFGS